MKEDYGYVEKDDAFDEDDAYQRTLLDKILLQHAGPTRISGVINISMTEKEYFAMKSELKLLIQTIYSEEVKNL